MSAILDRSNGLCEARTPVCSGRAVHVHHRRIRAQGGGVEPENLLAVCLHCHNYIHAHPAVSYARGWMLRASA